MPQVAPFPYYGGKRRIAPMVWERFGDPDRYLEMFFGSGAVLLYRDVPIKMEIVCETNGYVVNAWRSIQQDFEQTAYHCHNPSFHDDLTARQKTLYAWREENRERLREDARYCNFEMAGWWIWGVSNWIGGGYAEPTSGENFNQKIPMSTHRIGSMATQVTFNDKRPEADHPKGSMVSQNKFYDQAPRVSDGKRGVGAERFNESIPHVSLEPGGTGVQMQKRTFHDKVPKVDVKAGGSGVGQQRTMFDGSRPAVGSDGSGQGVQMFKRQNHGNGEPIRHPPWHSEVMYEIFEKLQKRLRGVVVMNRSWESLTSPSVLGDTRSYSCDCAIFMDPPYLTENRNRNLYRSDIDKESSDVAVASYAWAVDNGERYKIAYCCHEGDFEIPTGWTAEVQSFSGVRREDRRDRRDMVMFSPKCHDPQVQRNLF